MTSIGSAFSFAVTGLRAAESAFSIRTQNISNAQTPGYAPLKPELSATAAGPRVDAREAGGPLRPLLSSETSAAALASGVDLAQESVGLLTAGQAFKANAAVLKASDELQGELLLAVSADRRA